MKRLLIFNIFMLIILAAGLLGNKQVKAKYTGDMKLSINIGFMQGVELGMRGEAQRIVEDSTDNETVAIKMGNFEVTLVKENSSELYLTPNNSNLNLNKIDRVEFNTELIPYKEKLDDYIENKKYGKAWDLTRQLLALKPNDKNTIPLNNVLGPLASNQITLKDYIDYKKLNPDAKLLDGILEKLYIKDPKLPPPTYMDESIPMVTNDKGYYELTFKDKNDLVMIYIPEKRLFVEKFEVSVARTRQAGITVEPVKFSDRIFKSYPENCPDYPAIMSYKNALQYCSTYGLRLPTEEEWEYIAGNAEKETKWIYSWGNEEPGVGGFYPANFESLLDNYKEIAPVESFIKFSSPYGAVNMCGNVWEWIQDGYTKGGDFFSEKDELKITAKSKDNIYVGLRCVMEAK